MPTDIDMASNALLLVGDNPISSFSDPGAGAQVAAAIYPETYRKVLAEHPWTFALREQKLNQLSAQPDSLTNYKFAYQIPGEMIRIWAVFPHSDYTIVGSLLYSNENELLARYVYQVEETELPPQVTKAIEYKLASDFAVSVTESVSNSEYYEKKYLDAIQLARSVDSQNKPPVPIIDSPFVDVRYSGANRGFFY